MEQQISPRVDTGDAPEELFGILAHGHDEVVDDVLPPGR